jgi:hypothetical protein
MPWRSMQHRRFLKPPGLHLLLPHPISSRLAIMSNSEKKLTRLVIKLWLATRMLLLGYQVLLIDHQRLLSAPMVSHTYSLRREVKKMSGDARPCGRRGRGKKVSRCSSGSLGPVVDQGFGLQTQPSNNFKLEPCHLRTSRLPLGSPPLPTPLPPPTSYNHHV